MTYAPAKLLEWRAYMRGKTGLSDNSLGIVGGESHKLTGTSYHLGKDELKMWKDPYSARHPRDAAGLTNAASASDTGWFSRLVELTAWAVAEARAGRRPDSRELIGPASNGRAYRWAVENNWTARLRPEGDSHETHLHEGYFRDSEDRDKVGFYRPFFEGTVIPPMASTQTGRDVWGEEIFSPALNHRDSAGGWLKRIKIVELNTQQIIDLTRAIQANTQQLLVRPSGVVDPIALAQALIAQPAFITNLAAAIADIVGTSLPDEQEIATAVADELQQRLQREV